MILALNDIQYLNKLEFRCYVEILNITYVSVPKSIMNTKSYYYHKNINMHKCCEYEWNINGKLLKDFKNAKYGQTFYSEEIDNCWILGIFPDYNGNVVLWVQCIRLPVCVLKLQVQTVCVLTVDNDEIELYDKAYYSYKRNIKCILEDDDLEFKYLQSTECCLSIKMCLKITKVYGETEIDPMEWKLYGIMD
eukprot:546018_1